MFINDFLQKKDSCSGVLHPINLLFLMANLNFMTIEVHSRVLAVRPARRTDASAPLSAGAASPPPLLAWGGENLLHLSSPVKGTVQ
jgi:hypothetical protein